MTKDREQQMLKASQLYPKHQQKVFVDGVLWGDSHPDLYSVIRKAVEMEKKHLIDKAYEWLIDRYENQGVILLEDINELKSIMEKQR